MPVKSIIALCLILCLLGTTLTACNVVPSISFNTTSLVPPPGGATGTSLPPDTWTQARPGVEVRYSTWQVDGGGPEDTMIITRFDLTKVHLTVSYQPDKPQMLSDWMKQTGALAVFNGGYFTSTNETAALVISNSTSYGTSYSQADGGGMLALDAQGHVSIQPLGQDPYDPTTEQLTQATQCRPMLMINGKRTQFEEGPSANRRTVVAVDKQGRLLVIISPSQAFSIDQLATLLAEHTELNIVNALNLDGGSSTGLYLKGGSTQVSLDSINPLPIVVSISA